MKTDKITKLFLFKDNIIHTRTHTRTLAWVNDLVLKAPTPMDHAEDTVIH